MFNFATYLTDFMLTIFRNSLLLLSFLVTSFLTLSQGISANEIKDLNVDQLSKAEVVKIKNEMNSKNMSMNTLENVAILNGMSATDFSILKNRIESLDAEVNESNIEKGISIVEKPIELDKRSALQQSTIFGSEIFSNASLSFEPNSNMPTPTNYILGVGDELQVVIYGMQEFSSTVSVTREGKISIPIVGQVYVNGLTFDAAKTQIKKACSKIYSSLNSGQSTISISISKIRSIRITILGANKPGNYTVSSLSTVFNALHIAGGPDANGSYRNIELIRNNKIVKTIDIYKFLMNGDQSDNINLLDNDIIRIPVYKNRVKIEGKVKRPGVFELLPQESFLDLLRYCSDFDEAAYKSNIKLVQNTEKELKIIDLTESQYQTYVPVSGDVFKVSSLLNRFENKVSIKGSVFRPDDYALYDGMTIDDLIQKADGLTEDAFKTRAQLIREKEDLTKEILNIDLSKDNKGIKLRKNDELIVSSLFDLTYVKNVTIGGFVKKPGTYPFIKNLTLYDVIIQAGGFLEGSSKIVEISSVIIKDEKVDLKEKSVSKIIEIDTLLSDLSKNILLSPYDVINIRKKPVFEVQRNVNVVGQVFYPGDYTFTNQDETFLDLINRSGGLRNTAYKKGIYVLRNIDKISTENKEFNAVKIPINYKRILRRPNSRFNLVLKVGDEIHIPKVVNTVQVFGKVYVQAETSIAPGRGVRYYLRSAGGVKKTANKNKIYLIYQNGKVKNTRSFLFFRFYPLIKSGCEIHVPTKIDKPEEGEIQQIKEKLSIVELSVISGVISSITGMVIAIINLLQ
jgi:protein involved in polysaccharide export with SLBB domain